MRRLTSIDLFAGCGGLTRGLEWSGFECLAFNELNKDAADSFAANFPNALRLDGDIRTAILKSSQRNIASHHQKGGGVGPDLWWSALSRFSGIGHRRTHKLDKRTFRQTTISWKWSG